MIITHHAFDSEWVNLSLVLFYWKISNFRRIYRSMEVRFNFTSRASLFSQLFYLVFIMLFLSHIFGCIWSFIGLYESEHNLNSWMRRRNIEYEAWDVIYLNAVYFSIVTMCTVGYGDIVPATYRELIFSVFCILSATGVFAYNVNEVGCVFNELKKRAKLA